VDASWLLALEDLGAPARTSGVPGETSGFVGVGTSGSGGVTRREEILSLRAEAARTRLAEERRAPERLQRQLERLYVDDHLSVAEIARRLGRSDHWVRTVLIRAEIPFRRRSLPPVSELARLYIEEKLSTREIAARFGVSQAKVWRALRDAAVPRRSKASPPRGPVSRSHG
jgi:predicted DNA-binding protein YlxM (UPF0122 family)